MYVGKISLISMSEILSQLLTHYGVNSLYALAFQVSSVYCICMRGLVLMLWKFKGDLH